MKIKEDHIFLFILGLVCVAGMYGLFKTPGKTSASEQRQLAQFQHLTFRNFMNGSFQDNFESALSDQFIRSEDVRSIYGQAISGLPVFGLDMVVCSNHYVEAAGSTNERRRAFFDCGDYLVGYPEESNKNKENVIKKYVERYNRINKMADVYYYFVERYSMFDFETNTKTIDMAKILDEHLEGESGLGIFELDNYEDHKRYFYKTDHHWNYEGSYKGYLEMCDMLGVKEVSKPIGVINNHDLYYGSHSKAIQNYSSKEEFAFYDFDLPAHDVYIAGKKAKYGHYKEYKNNDYSNVSDYYHFVYGQDSGEVIFDYHNKNKENLLIISDSYGDPIKELIAQHFNKTYSVDLRHYKEITGKEFVPAAYIKENKIDKVLFILSPPFLTSETLNQGLEL